MYVDGQQVSGDITLIELPPWSTTNVLAGLVQATTVGSGRRSVRLVDMSVVKKAREHAVRTSDSLEFLQPLL